MVCKIVVLIVGIVIGNVVGVVILLFFNFGYV